MYQIIYIYSFVSNRCFFPRIRYIKKSDTCIKSGCTNDTYRDRYIYSFGEPTTHTAMYLDVLAMYPVMISPVVVLAKPHLKSQPHDRRIRNPSTAGTQITNPLNLNHISLSKSHTTKNQKPMNPTYTRFHRCKNADLFYHTSNN